MRLGHIAIVTADLERTKGLYEVRRLKRAGIVQRREAK